MGSDLSIALSGVLAARQAIDVVGSNLANARTEGYARRKVEFSGTSWTMAEATGSASSVRVAGVYRTKDAFLEARLQDYMGSLARNEVQISFFSELEGILQEPSDEGIGAALETFFNQWQGLATRPTDTTVRTTLLLSASQLAEKMRILRESMVDIRQAALMEVEQSIEQVNSLTSRLAEINSRLVVGSTGSGTAPLSIEDERDRLVRDLAELVGAVDLTPGEPTVRLTIGSTLLVDGSIAVKLQAPDDVGSPITVEGRARGVAVEATGGEVAGLMSLIRDTLPAYISSLDELAGKLVETVNSVHLEGIARDGRMSDLAAANALMDMDGDGDVTNDLLSAAGLPFALTGGNITINVADDATGTVTAHTIAVDPKAMTVGDLVAALEGVANLSAVVQDGRLRIVADAGYGFDFAAPQESNALTALGMNGFFEGYDAATIRLAGRLDGRPERIAAGQTMDSGDGQNALRLADLRYATAFEVENITLSDHWRGFVTQVGNQSANLRNVAETQRNLVEVVKTQEEAISGVSSDEEAAKLLEYQQMYQACARYLGVVSRLADSLLEIV